MKELVSLCTTALVAVLLTGTMLFSAGCTCSPHPRLIDRPAVTSDCSGGALTAYEVRKSSDERACYVQRIDAEGNSLWRAHIGDGYKRYGHLFGLQVVHDKSGGAIITWQTYPSRPDWEVARGRHQVPYVTYVTKVDGKGGILWQREVRGVDQMICDGSGGAFIGYLVEGTAMILRIDAEGDFPWGEEGISLGLKSASWGWQMVSDEVGGILAVQQNENGQILVQRIDSDGNILWGEHGILLYSPLEGISAEQAQLINDGSGGAIVIWHQWSEGKIEIGKPEALLNDICAQRVDASGNVLWQQNGVLLGITKGGDHTPDTPRVVSDGTGGAIIIWEDLRQWISIYAQRIDAEGNVKWQEGGVQVCCEEKSPASLIHHMVSDTLGGAIIIWWMPTSSADSEGLLVAQRIDAEGKSIWSEFGTAVARSRSCCPPVISQDRCGGVLVAWSEGQNSYVQRIDANSSRLWGEKGIRLNS